MDKSLLKLERGTSCTSWNYSGQRLAAGSLDGTITVFDARDPASSSFDCSSRFKVHHSSIVKINWVPPEYGMCGNKTCALTNSPISSNLGPLELIAVASEKGISIWQIGVNLDRDGRLSVERVALLSGHQGDVWQMEWDMSGMTLVSTGSDGVVRLWQSNLNGV